MHFIANKTANRGVIISISLLVLLNLFIFPISSLSAQTNNVDSMVAIVDSQKGEERLQTLRNICQVKQYELGGLKFIAKYEQEAVKQGSAEDELKSNMFYAYHYFAVRDNNDSLTYYVDKIEKNALEQENFTIDVFNQLVIKNLSENKFELAIYYIQEVLSNKKFENNNLMKIVAYQNMTLAYYYSHNIPEGLEAIQKVIDLLDNSPDIPDYTQRILLSKSYLMQCLLAYRSSNLELALSICDNYEKKISGAGLPAHLQHNIGFSNVLMLIMKASVYAEQREVKKARELLDTLKVRLESYPDVEGLHMSYSEAESQYYYAIGDFPKSIKYIDVSIANMAVVPHFANDLIELNIYKSKYLFANKQYDEAYTLLEKSFQQKDSLQARFSSQIKELHMIYKTKQVRAEMNSKLERIQIIAFALLCIILLSIGLFVLYRRHVKTKERSNKKLYTQYMQLKSYLEELSIQKEANKKLNATESGNGDKTDSLADRADEYLRTSENFKNKDLTRTELALSLGTNRQYLTDAIREKTGMTFKDYINDIRLEYAHKLLIENDTDSIEKIYTEAGFASRNTFNRVFRDKFGMSPNELRVVVKNQINDMIRHDTKRDEAR